MFTWFYRQHDFIISQDTRYRKHSTRNSFPKYKNIRANIFMIAGEHFASTTKACLYLVCHKKDIVFFTQLSRFFQIAITRNINSGLGLDRLYQKSGSIGMFQFPLKCIDIVIWNIDKTGCERAVSLYDSGSDDIETIVMVRPWKLPSQTTICASFLGILFTLYPHFRISLRAVSSASAPEFIGKTLSYPNCFVINSSHSPKTLL